MRRGADVPRVPLAGLLAAALVLSAPALAQRAAPPPGWKATESATVCALDAGPIAVLKAPVRGGGDVLGRGSAYNNYGIVVVVPNWQTIHGDDRVLVRLPGQARYSATIRQIAPENYFIVWGEGQWFNELGNYDRIEIEAPPQRWRGPRATIRYSAPQMKQALAWLRGCRL